MNLAPFVYATLIGWLLSAWLGAKMGGSLPEPILRWHPARFFCEPLALAQDWWKCLAFLPLPALMFAGVLHKGWMPWLPLWLLLVVPIPLMLFDYVRRDTGLRSKQYVYFNPFTPVSSRFVRHLENGKMLETNPTVYLYLTPDDWKSITTITVNDVKFFERYRVKGTQALYKANADNEFLHFFDSHQLCFFVVQPENRKAMQALEDGLKLLFDKQNGLGMPATVPVPAVAAGTQAPTSTTATVPPPAAQTESTSELDLGDFSMGSEPPPPPFADMEETPQIVDPQALVGRSGNEGFKPKRRIKPGGKPSSGAPASPGATVPPPTMDNDDDVTD